MLGKIIMRGKCQKKRSKDVERSDRNVRKKTLKKVTEMSEKMPKTLKNVTNV